MVFAQGDVIVHPARGVGIVTRLEERRSAEGNRPYYRIKMMDGTGTLLMIPTSASDKLGLRPAMAQSEVTHVWGVLIAASSTLPRDHKERYEILETKLSAGDVLQVAEVVRDLAERRRQGQLTTVGRRIYDKGMMFLAGEIAAVQGVKLADAEAEIRARLQEAAPPAD